MSDPARLRPSLRLPSLIPGVYHQRDARVVSDGGAVGTGLELVSPLTALTGVLGRGLDELYDAIGGLWDDHFVERAHPEALALIADLFRARFVTADPVVQRAVLARIVHWRRRKGTLATLEEVLSITSRWDVEADEGYRSLLITQDLRDLTPWRGRTAVLWDPIGLSDPLTRRSLGDRRPRADVARVRGPLIEVLPGETVDDTVRRLGRIDAGRIAASPRTLELRGWARPDAVAVRAARLHAIELEGLRATGAAVTVPHGQRGYHVDPLRRDTPLVWLAPVEPPDEMALFTARHEPAVPVPPIRQAARLLTPTTLADDPDLVESLGGFQCHVHGVPLVGPRPVQGQPQALPYAPVGAEPVLRFAEDARPAPGDRWQVTLLATVGDGDLNLPSDNLVKVVAELTDAGPTLVAPVQPVDGLEELAGHVVELQVSRLDGAARRRTAAGVWSDLDLTAPLGAAASNAAVVTVGAETWIIRFELDLAAQTNVVTSFTVGPGAAWMVRFAPTAVPAPLDTAAGIAVLGDGADLLVVAADPGTGTLGLWAITGLAGLATITRLDAPVGGVAPLARKSPHLALHGGRLYVHGGDVDGAAAGDVWSIAPGGGAWTAHPVYRQQERMGATLLSTPAGLVLLGGDEVPGAMRHTVHQWDPSVGKAWRALPSLPFTNDRPGTLVARVDGAGDLHVLAWADRTRPRAYRLTAGASAWDVPGPIEDGPDGTSPPGAGEAVFVGDDLLIVAPPPLPPSELLLVLGGQGYLAFLPRLALPIKVSDPDPFALRLRVATDGGTYERTNPTGPTAVRGVPLDARFGGAFSAGYAQALGGDQRFSAPGRLSRTPWRLVQRSLGPWDQLVASTAEPAVMLDPRLGRFVLPPGAPTGPVTSSAFVGRPGAIGVGSAAADDELPRAWAEPTAGPFAIEPWAPIDAADLPHAYLEPRRAGQTHDGITMYRDLPAALTASRLLDPTNPPRLAVIGSPTIPAARLSVGLEHGLALWNADPGSAPVFEVDEEAEVSLALHVDETTAPIPAPPHLALAGLWLTGRLELVVASGTIDIRACHLGQPGTLALWIPGGGHQQADARWSIPEPEVELRLYGCVVGKLELPPWVKLVAAGCIFDAGGRDDKAIAIEAAGAHVRLRHCTLYGGINAGLLEASSCVIAGVTTVDRQDLGFVRHSLVQRGGRPPTLHASLVHSASFISARPTDPGYLALAENNGPALRAGEDGTLPGAYAERGDHERELTSRAGDFLPIAMTPVHLDRTTHDLYRLDRR